MDAEKCAEILLSAIHARERLHRDGLCTSSGERIKIDPTSDDLYAAMQFALACVEEKIKQ